MPPHARDDHAGSRVAVVAAVADAVSFVVAVVAEVVDVVVLRRSMPLALPASLMPAGAARVGDVLRSC